MHATLTAEMNKNRSFMVVPHHQRKTIARFLLMLAILQCAFVAFESAGVTHSFEESNNHHELALAHDASELSTPTNLNEDACDHCCHCCHGHSAHFSLQSNQYLILIAHTSRYVFPQDLNLQSAFIHAIHRPPIT